MFRLTLTVALCALACSGIPDLSVEPPSSIAPPAADDVAGVRLEPQDGNFHIVFPKGFPAPKRETVSIPTAVGPIEMTMYSAEQGNAFVGVSQNQYPSVSFDTQTISEMLDNVRDGAIKSTNATLREQQDLEVDGHPARSFISAAMQSGIQLYMRQLIVLNRPHLIQAQWASTDLAALSSPEAEAFFGSLAITSGPAQPEQSF